MRGRAEGTPVTLQPSCVRARLRKGTGDWNPAVAGGVAAGRGLAKAVGGAAAHRGGSDGRDVVGGGCTPLLARAPATNDHPWSIHGGFIRQVRPTSCCCYCCRYCVSCLLHLSRYRRRCRFGKLSRVPVCFDCDSGSMRVGRGRLRLGRL